MQSPVYFYSEEKPTDKSYKFWRYEEGVPTVWTEYVVEADLVDEQGITYGYDTKANCYYVGDNTKFTGDTVIIPTKYNDGVHGELDVKYVADLAFNRNANIKKVILPETVDVLGASAFHYCTSLEYLSMTGVQDISNTSAIKRIARKLNLQRLLILWL